MVGSQPINGSDKSSSLVLCTNLERPTMSDNMTINRLRFGFHRSDNRFQNSVPVLALIYTNERCHIQLSLHYFDTNIKSYIHNYHEL